MLPPEHKRMVRTGEARQQRNRHSAERKEKGARPEFTVTNGRDLYIEKCSGNRCPFNDTMQNLQSQQKSLTAVEILVWP